MRIRKSILLDLINNRVDTSSLISELSKYSWDRNEPIIVINNEDICKILNKYINGDLSSGELENWANTIECSEDLAFENDSLENVINRIANPVLYGVNDINKVNKYCWSLPTL